MNDNYYPDSVTGPSWWIELPPGFDKDTRLALMQDNTVLAFHPQHSPVVLNEKERRWEPLPPA